MTNKSISVSANIPEDLGKMLDRVSQSEERSKSYYIKKGLEKLLKDKIQDLEDYEDAKHAHSEFISSGEKGVSFEEVFKNVE